MKCGIRGLLTILARLWLENAELKALVAAYEIEIEELYDELEG